VRADTGCHVISNVIQALCEQHWITGEPGIDGGFMEVLIELEPEQRGITTDVYYKQLLG
jgi:hypothetical protein